MLDVCKFPIEVPDSDLKTPDKAEENNWSTFRRSLYIRTP